jgi:low affinity Fe/Cu permease
VHNPSVKLWVSRSVHDPSVKLWEAYNTSANILSGPKTFVLSMVHLIAKACKASYMVVVIQIGVVVWMIAGPLVPTSSFSMVLV